MTVQAYQLLPALDEEQRDALRQSIEANGILQPIEVDETGRILDGHHRAAIAAELGIACPSRTVEGLDDEAGKRRYAITVNLMRRQLDKTMRGALVAQLRTEGLSVRAIAQETGIPKSTVSDALAELSGAGQLDRPDRIKSLDGKERPATQPRRQPAPEPPAPDDGSAAPGAGLPTVADEPEAVWGEREPTSVGPVSPKPEAPDDTPSIEDGLFDAPPPVHESHDPAVIDEETKRRSSLAFAKSLASLWLALDPDPVNWVATRWRSDVYPERDLPRVRDVFTTTGLRSLAKHIDAIADHLDRTGGVL